MHTNMYVGLQVKGPITAVLF